MPERDHSEPNAASLPFQPGATMNPSVRSPVSVDSRIRSRREQRARLRAQVTSALPGLCDELRYAPRPSQIAARVGAHVDEVIDVVVADRRIPTLVTWPRSDRRFES